jgi:hypothetical protein
MTRLVDRTHGRWPWVAAAGAVPATAVYVARGGQLAEGAAWALWGSLPALFWHETEEWVVPGGFMPWFNRELMGCSEDEAPLGRRTGLVVNVCAGWGLSTAAGLRGLRSPWLAAALLTSHVGNAGLHLATAARTRRYNPGAATSALLLAPLGLGGLAALARRPEVRARELTAGVAVGVAGSVALFALMRRRVR